VALKNWNMRKDQSFQK